MTLRLLLLLLLITSSPIAFAADFNTALHTPAYRPGELIVRYKDDAVGVKSLAALKASSAHSFSQIKAHQIKLDEQTSVDEALEQFRADPNVLYAEPNYIVRKASTPNDPLFSSQWNMTQISAPTAWNSYTGPFSSSSSLIVAVLDTGIAYTHNDLTNNLWVNPGEICGNGIDDDGNGYIDDCYGINLGGSRPKGDPWDDDTEDSHGTHLAGIIGAVGNNGIGVTGINWNVRIMAVKFLHGPKGEGDLANALKGTEYALARGAKVINMSFEVNYDSKSLRDAIDAADRKGVLVISAAGNGSKNIDSSPVYPASIRTANNISVAASTNLDTLSSFSNYSKNSVDLAAPGGTKGGVAILSTVWLDNGSVLYRQTAGTSMAAPHVAGAAALIWNKHPNLTAYQVKARILNSVDKLSAFTDKTVTGGRLNLYKALTAEDLPTISDDTKTTAYRGSSYSISGVNFGNQKGTVVLTETSVSLASKTAVHTLEIESWSDTAIKVRIPEDASSGTLKVTPAGSSKSVDFNLKVTDSPKSGGGGGGGCFIATAAWGSYLHPKVMVLREFRDQHLLGNGPGRLFVKAYYAASPPVADFIAQHENLRTATRLMLTPVIWAVEAPMMAGITLLLVIAGLTVTTVKARQRMVLAKGKANIQE